MVRMKTPDKTKNGKHPIADSKECKASPKKPKTNPPSTGVSNVGAALSSSRYPSIMEFTGKIPLLQPHSAINSRSRFIRFDNEEEAKRFVMSTSKLHVHIERNFDMISFIRNSREQPNNIPRHLYHWIHSRAWEGLLSCHKYGQDIVHEFYFCGSHLVSNSYAEHEDRITAKVQGYYFSS